MSVALDVVEEVLHDLIDAVTGRANLNPVRASDLHDKITPGYNDVPLTDAEIAELDKLEARRARYEGDKAARAAADNGTVI